MKFPGCPALPYVCRSGPQMNYDTDGRAETVPVHDEPIELYKLLKLSGLVRSGGEAKHVIAAGLVRLNGAVEKRKRKKVVAGDTVDFADKVIRVTFV